MPDPGELDKRLKFQKRPTEADDGYGNTEGDWETQFTCAAKVEPRRGGSETVIAQRLAGVQPVFITIRSCAAARKVAPHWRAVDARCGTVYNIRAGANFDMRNAMLEFVAETGLPT